MVEHDDRIDFALAAYREDGQWTVQDLAHDHLGDIETIAHALRRLPGDGGAVAMVAVDEDFFVIVRVAGATTRVLLSDVTAAEDWELAGSAVEFLGLPELELEDEDEQVPAGDLDLLGDLGHARHGDGRCSSTTSTSTPTRSSPTWRAGSASASSSTTPSASPPPDGS